MKRYSAQHLVLTVCFLAVCGYAFAANQDALSDYSAKSYYDTAPRLRDADTLVVGGVPVRLFGIDAPDANAQLAQAATDYLAQMLITQGGVTCSAAKIDSLTDGQACSKAARSYDRITSLCRFNATQTSVGATLVAHGYAVDYRLFSNGIYAPDMVLAARGRRGLWRSNFSDMQALAVRRSELPIRCRKQP